MPSINENETSLLDVARAFKAEYDGLRSSRAIALYLKARNRFSKKPYTPLELAAEWPQEKTWMRLKSKENAGNWFFYDHRQEFVSHLPESNGCAYYAGARRPRVGIITDEFMFDYYDGPLDLTYLYPDSYQEAIDDGNLDFVLYVTCWHGRHDQVDTYYSNDPEGHERISAVFDAARQAGLPIVFQSIEDPPSYELYLDLARQADYVFTSCEEKIPDYLRDLGHDRVFSCKFGVNPLLNNPVGIGIRSHLKNEHLRNSVLFAGSWYNEYPERCADTELIFDTLLSLGRNLMVFDRRWPVDLTIGGMFPEKYWYYVLPGLNHKELQAVTKLFDFAVSLNSVKDSRTMCAMRTYELQAAGVIGIANDALALKAQFPELVRAKTAEDVRTFLNDMDSQAVQRAQLEGIRRIMRDHTVYDRLNQMFSQMDMDFTFPTAAVALLANPNDAHAWKRAQSLDATLPSAKAVCLDNLAQAKDCSFAVVLSGASGMDAPAVEDAVNAFKYVDTAFVRICALNAPERFSYVQESMADLQECVYNLRTVSLEDIARTLYARDEAVDKTLEGFAVPAAGCSA